MMVRILVTGSNGQLGNSLRQMSHQFSQFEFTWLDIQDLDLTSDNQMKEYFSKHRFDYIINCAAYTAVDMAEKEPEKAYAVNASVPARLGEICTRYQTRLIHMSTDYIYDGNLSLPHLEDESPNPQSTYAKSKLDGEKILWNSNNTIIIRTSWLYSEFGNNFLKTILRLSKERKELTVIYDQVGTPTYASDLAAAIMQIIGFSDNDKFMPGIYNYSNEGVCSWFDFATEITDIAGITCKIKPVRTQEYPLPAVRPFYSVLDKSKIKRIFGLQIPYWKYSLQNAIIKLES